jgi:hypothetical protein
MSVGNWRDHILVKCRTCKKLMGWHKVTEDAECIECEIERRDKNNKEVEG